MCLVEEVRSGPTTFTCRAGHVTCAACIVGHAGQLSKPSQDISTSDTWRLVCGARGCHELIPEVVVVKAVAAAASVDEPANVLAYMTWQVATNP